MNEDREILRQIASGIEHLHEKGVAHRDLNPGNILISFHDGTVPRKIQIADFGFSRRKENDEKSRFGRTVKYHGYSEVLAPFGTHGWIGPEGYTSRKDYKFSVDIFPMACIFGFILTKGKSPFSEKPVSDWDPEEVENVVKRIRQQSTTTSVLTVQDYQGDIKAFNLIEKMLNPNPDLRPTATQVLNDLYFEGMKGSTIVVVEKIITTALSYQVNIIRIQF